MKQMPDECIDLTVTSPPYDNLRDYKGYTFDFEGIAEQLFRITKKGGVVVWVVGDATINGSETGTSFRQALYFKEIGFNLHDTMIYYKNGNVPQKHSPRYEQRFEYMFVLSRGRPKSFNPMKHKRLWEDTRTAKNFHRNQEGKYKLNKFNQDEYVKNHNVWLYKVFGGQITDDKMAHNHPAIFPDKLARDHIASWSNPDDIVYDPMGGSGTTIVQAAKLDRRWLMTEISPEYCNIAQKRVDAVMNQTKLKLE